MNILLVDDEALALMALKSAVSKAVPSAELHPFSNAESALEAAENTKFEVAFLDINMFGMDGLEMAKRLTAINPTMNIIFCTGYAEYAVEAFRLYSSGFLLKPISAKDITEAMGHLRYPIELSKRLKCVCFGSFEAYCDGKPILFTFNKTKELLALLIDRNGALCTTPEIIGALFEDSKTASYYQKLRTDLLATFEELKLLDCLFVNRGSMGICREKVDCDYFDYMDGKITRKPTEYMTRYSFAEMTFAQLFS